MAYEALELIGYFSEFNRAANNDIGVYLGAYLNNYNNNIILYPPNTFSSLGILGAFLTGRINYYISCTRPSIMYNTACSSSAVAIYIMYKALKTCKCLYAITGGVNLYTNLNFYQNLTTISFHNFIGPYKPFNIKVNKYSYKKGINLIILKRLSNAITDNYSILNIIKGLGVNQNKNLISLIIPHSLFQAKLIKRLY